MFQEELHKEVVAQIPEYEKKKSEFIEERLKLSARIKGIAPQITDEDYKFLLNVLHPDRAPEDRKDRFSKAFDIVRKLDQYIQSGKAMTA